MPAIAVAAAAPAFATSGANLETSTGTATSPNGVKPITVTLRIVNTGSAPTCDLRVTVTAPNQISSTQSAPTGWTVVSPIGTNSITYDANAQLGPVGSTNSTMDVTFVVDRGSNASGTVTVYIDPGCGGTPRTLSFTI